MTVRCLRRGKCEIISFFRSMFLYTLHHHIFYSFWPESICWTSYPCAYSRRVSIWICSSGTLAPCKALLSSVLWNSSKKTYTWHGKSMRKLVFWFTPVGSSKYSSPVCKKILYLLTYTGCAWSQLSCRNLVVCRNSCSEQRNETSYLVVLCCIFIFCQRRILSNHLQRLLLLDLKHLFCDSEFGKAHFY